MTAPTPVFYNCEASDLEGYPIEIGWASTDPETNAIVSESRLIKPPAEWPVEEEWDPATEGLHGIALERLQREGRPAWEVARRMNTVLAGRELFSDALQDEACSGLGEPAYASAKVRAPLGRPSNDDQHFHGTRR